MGPVLVETDGKLTRVTLNRPDKRNALNRETVDALREAVSRCSEPGKCKLLILTGAGDAFCAGADLADLQQLQHATQEENIADSRALADLFSTMHRFPGILFGAVNGHALAGGCGLVSLCDIAVTHEAAKFGYTETRIGFVPALVSRYLMEKMPAGQATRLLLGGEVIDASEALRVGLVHEVTPKGSFEARVSWWTDHVMGSLSHKALVSTKQLLRSVAGMGLAEASETAVAANALARSTDDCKRGIAAFLAKETLRWD